MVHGPAGATFGPVLGLMVFAYITARLVLFATAWAATSTDNLRAGAGCAAGPGDHHAAGRPGEGMSARQTVAAVAVGAVGALGLSRLWRQRPRVATVRAGRRLIDRATMIRPNTIIVPTTPTPTRTGTRVGGGQHGEALAAAALAVVRLRRRSATDRGRSALPTLVPGGVAKP